MTVPDRKAVQQAIDFLTSLDPGEIACADLPPRSDPRALVRIAGERGLALSGEELQEGFRVMMRARLFANRIAGRSEGPPAGRV